MNPWLIAALMMGLLVVASVSAYLFVKSFNASLPSRLYLESYRSLCSDWFLEPLVSYSVYEAVVSGSINVSFIERFQITNCCYDVVGQRSVCVGVN